jgi:hypothetical protein
VWLQADHAHRGDQLHPPILQYVFTVRKAACKTCPPQVFKSNTTTGLLTNLAPDTLVGTLPFAGRALPTRCACSTCCQSVVHLLAINFSKVQCPFWPAVQRDRCWRRQQRTPDARGQHAAVPHTQNWGWGLGATLPLSTTE